MIHRVKEVVIEKVDQQGRNGVFVKDIKIKTEDGEIQITLFSDKKENIETKIDEKRSYKK